MQPPCKPAQRRQPLDLLQGGSGTGDDRRRCLYSYSLGAQCGAPFAQPDTVMCVFAGCREEAMDSALAGSEEEEEADEVVDAVFEGNSLA